MTKAQQTICDLARTMRDLTGKLPSRPGIFQGYAARIVRTDSDGIRELAVARRGMPCPAFAQQAKKVDKGVTNVRDTGSLHWRHWVSVDASAASLSKDDLESLAQWDDGLGL